MTTGKKIRYKTIRNIYQTIRNIYISNNKSNISIEYMYFTIGI